MKLHIGLFLLILMMVLPKLTVIPAGFSGVRLDDFISLIAFAWIISRGRLRLSSTDSYVKIYLFFIGTQFVSAIYNYESNSYIGLLFPIRLLELLVWYYIGINVIKSRTKEEINRVLLFLGLYFSIYSFAEILGFAPKFGLFTVTNRVATTMTGPFEYAVVIAVLGFFIKHSIPKAMTLVSLLLTQSRVTLFSTLFIYLFIWKKKWSSLITFIIGALLLIIVSPKLDVLERFDGFNEFGVGNIAELTSQYYSMVSPADSSKDYFESTHEESSAYKLFNQTDTSLEMRLMRWMVILKTTNKTIYSLLIGQGPGFYGIAVDGYYVRVFAETGLIGLSVFVLFLVSLYRTHKKSKEIVAMIVTMALSGLLIDIFVSVKVMALFWFLLGVHSQKYHKNNSN
ncbi:hypothetical protein N9356_03055 [Porticoccaceae bacterium]|nr:hypothetical protein [Porticoccaceae bacterium]